MAGIQGSGAANRISDDPAFRRSRLYRAFRENPLGFVDVGSAGGVHPIVLPIASLVQCTCFEPDEGSHATLNRSYSDASPFREVRILNTAVAGEKGTRDLFVTRSRVNTSLLQPKKEFARRYNLKGFDVESVESLKTETLDTLLGSNGNRKNRSGELIKLDCQGAEYEILEGAERVLHDQCMALICEVELSQLYEGQKLFRDVDAFLSGKGFVLYGFYPNYISSKKIDRRGSDTEERIIWADTLYFKDPLDAVNRDRQFTEREIDVLMMVAILSKYFDLAAELAGRYVTNKEEEKLLQAVVQAQARKEKEDLERELSIMVEAVTKRPEMAYLLAKKFVDRHKSNNNIDFIDIPTS